MSRRWEDWPPPSRPRRAEGGIKAKSKRGAIGEQWWSRRFIAVLESYGMSGRLARGRSYARAGQVLEFSLAQGKVTAKVQGSRVRPYQVHIGVLPLTKPQWRRVEERLASQALFRAKLLAGEMPHEIEEIFADCGTPLFPELAGDLDMRCSCPDWEVPCKHLAAVCYVLAEAFDADPFGMLAWRGKGRDDLLAALRSAGPARSAGRPAKPGSAEKSGPAAKSGTAAKSGSVAESGSVSESGAAAAPRASWQSLPLRPASPPLAECLDSFWAGGLSAARLRALSAAPAQQGTPDLLLRMYEPPPVTVRGKDLLDVLTPAYQQLATDEER